MCICFIDSATTTSHFSSMSVKLTELEPFYLANASYLGQPFLTELTPEDNSCKFTSAINYCVHVFSLYIESSPKLVSKNIHFLHIKPLNGSVVEKQGSIFSLQ